MGKKKDTTIDKKKAAAELAEINRQLEEVDNITDFVNAPMQLMCGKWICDSTGVYKLLPSKNDPDLLVRVEASFQQILPCGTIENIETGDHQCVISFSTKLNGVFIWKTVNVDPMICSTKNKIVSLSRLGISVNDENAKNLVKYISDIYRLNQDAIPRKKAISHLGWIKNDFFPYVQGIVFDGDQEQESIVNAFHPKGDFNYWIARCKQYRRNLVVRLAMAASFASVLISKIGGLCFAVHLWGGSGTGKTVVLILAASIWGEPDSLYTTINSTNNFLTNRASFLRNIPLLIDETQLASMDIEKLIYQLTEGKTRGRLSKDSKEKNAGSWSNTTILTGEKPIVDTNTGAGAVNRVIEIALDGALFDDFQETLETVRNNYGYAGRKFIEYIQQTDIDLLKSQYNAICKVLQKFDSTGKQIQGLAFVILADMISSQCVFEGEEALNVEKVAMLLKKKDDVSVSERAYRATVDWILENQNRFNDDPEQNKLQIWGKIDGDFAYINTSVLKKFLSDNKYNFDAVKKEWATKGYLIKDSRGQYTVVQRVNGLATRRVKLCINLQEVNTNFQQLTIEEINGLPFAIN